PHERLQVLQDIVAPQHVHSSSSRDSRLSSSAAAVCAACSGLVVRYMAFPATLALPPWMRGRYRSALRMVGNLWPDSMALVTAPTAQPYSSVSLSTGWTAT